MFQPNQILVLLDVVKNCSLTNNDLVVRYILQSAIVESKQKVKAFFFGGQEVEAEAEQC